MLSPKIIIGRIVCLSSHPNAEKLKVVQVVYSPKGNKLNVVCGAANIKEGDIVPLVLAGGWVFGPEGEKVRVEPREIRGVLSEGMMCSELELGLGNDHNGIFLLNHKLEKKIGQSFWKAARKTLSSIR